jgi:hypothetical protein
MSGIDDFEFTPAPADFEERIDMGKVEAGAVSFMDTERSNGTRVI